MRFSHPISKLSCMVNVVVKRCDKWMTSSLAFATLIYRFLRQVQYKARQLHPEPRIRANLSYSSRMVLMPINKHYSTSLCFVASLANLMICTENSHGLTLERRCEWALQVQGACLQHGEIASTFLTVEFQIFMRAHRKLNEAITQMRLGCRSPIWKYRLSFVYKTYPH